MYFFLILIIWFCTHIIQYDFISTQMIQSAAWLHELKVSWRRPCCQCTNKYMHSFKGNFSYAFAQKCQCSKIHHYIWNDSVARYCRWQAFSTSLQPCSLIGKRQAEAEHAQHVAQQILLFTVFFHFSLLDFKFNSLKWSWNLQFAWSEAHLNFFRVGGLKRILRESFAHIVWI